MLIASRDCKKRIPFRTFVLVDGGKEEEEKEEAKERYPFIPSRPVLALLTGRKRKGKEGGRRWTREKEEEKEERGKRCEDPSETSNGRRGGRRAHLRRFLVLFSWLSSSPLLLLILAMSITHGKEGKKEGRKCLFFFSTRSLASFPSLASSWLFYVLYVVLYVRTTCTVELG